MSTTVVRVTEPDDVAAMATLIAHSFDHLDANRWLVPDPALRLDAMREFFALLTEHAAAGAGRVYRTEDGAGVAVWNDRTIEPTEPPFFAERLEKATGQYIERFGALDEAFEATHPHEPHWHLAFLAVDPKHRNRGLGADLMRPMHDWLDEQGLPAYLEATNADSRRLYERHGYQRMDPADIVLGNPSGNTPEHKTGVVFHRMWRPPVQG